MTVLIVGLITFVSAVTAVGAVIVAFLHKRESDKRVDLCADLLKNYETTLIQIAYADLDKFDIKHIAHLSLGKANRILAEQTGKPISSSHKPVMAEPSGIH